MQFVAAVFDGAIFDKKKEGFVRNLKQRGLLLVDKIFFTCNTHGHALTTTLSMTRCMKDLGLKYDGPDGQPDPARRAPDCIWFKNEKQTYAKSFATFNLLLKTLKEKGKKKALHSPILYICSLMRTINREKNLVAKILIPKEPIALI